MQTGVFAFLCICLACHACLAASTSGLTVNGNFQFDGIGRYAYQEDLDSNLSYAGLSLLTLDIRTLEVSGAKVEGSVDIYQLHGQYVRTFAPEGVDSTGRLPIDSSSLLVYMRTLYAMVDLNYLDLTLGRQVINFGTGRLFTPIDVFTTINIFDIGLRRAGSDVAMATIPIGALSGVDLVTEFPFPDREYSTAIKGFSTFGTWDVSLVGLYRHLGRKALAGVSFKGDALVGLHGELVENFDRNTGTWTFEGMAGTDYSIPALWFFNFEYLFLQRVLAPDPLKDRHNIHASGQYIINELANLSVAVIASLPAERAIVTLQYFNNILQRVDTYWYLRYYNLKLPTTVVPDAELGLRVVVKF